MKEHPMQIHAETTETGGMKLTVLYGPVLLSVILDPSDEDAVVDMIRQAFQEARERKDVEHVYTG
jgi:hypothetical protein